MRKKVISIHSSSDNTDHQIIIRLPKSYGHSVKKYPVIILFDAQDSSLLDYATTTIDRLTGTNDLPEAIFIGVIQNDRVKELGIERSEETAKSFLQFIQNDLVIYLQKYYTINNYYTFIGHSLGGQFVTFAMTKYPEVFRSVISISGALNYPTQDPEYSFYKHKVLDNIENYLKSEQMHSSQQKYYSTVGTDGMQDQMFRLGASELEDMLKKYKPALISWRFDCLRDFNHMTTPLASIPAGLLFIYHDWHFSEDVAMDILLKQKTDALVALKAQEEHIQKIYGTSIELPVVIYYQFAQFYLNKGQIEYAKQVARKILVVQPNDDKPYALLADIFLKKGKKEEAIEQLKLAHPNLVKKNISNVLFHQ